MNTGVRVVPGLLPEVCEQGTGVGRGKTACVVVSWAGGGGEAGGKDCRSRLFQQQQPRREAIEARTRVVPVGGEREKQMREMSGREK